MTELPSARISLDGSNGEIQIDGAYLPGVTAIRMDARVGRPPILIVELALLDATADMSETAVIVPEATRDALVALGWTPPKAN